MIAIKVATKQGYSLMKSGGVCDISYPSSENRRARVQGQGMICPALMSQGNGGLLMKIDEEILALDEQNEILRTNGTVGTLTTDGSSPKHNNRAVIKNGKKYRIRKLTPRECGRLMGVSDADITRMQLSRYVSDEEMDKLTESDIASIDGNYVSENQMMSNSQLYKQYGNSIVVDVMCYMFQQLRCVKELEKDEIVFTDQMSLFDFIGE